MPPQFEDAVQRSILEFVRVMPATPEALEDDETFRRVWMAIEEQLRTMLARALSFVDACEGRARREQEWEDQAHSIEAMLLIWGDMGENPSNNVENRKLVQEMYDDIVIMRLTMESNRNDEIEDDRQRASPWGVPILPSSDSESD